MSLLLISVYLKSKIFKPFRDCHFINLLCFGKTKFSVCSFVFWDMCPLLGVLSLSIASRALYLTCILLVFFLGGPEPQKRKHDGDEDVNDIRHKKSKVILVV